ncbi:MAG: ApaG domain, partial [Aquamicrobium sp.]|nr:ApaG domain [Aquamicrobium sp.]
YTSGCPLRTPSGFMVGSYTVRSGEDDFFEIDIPAFSLDLPDGERSVN